MKLVAAALTRSCYAASYADARGRFLQAAARAGATVASWRHPDVTGPDGGELSTDIAEIGPPDADRVLLLVSGTHGPEGFIGSAAQVALLEELAHGHRPLDVRIVMVHAINPWGFAHMSRTTELNVDLNRNFIDWSRDVPANPDYDELHDWVCPPSLQPDVLAQAGARIDDWIARRGFDAYTDATTKGQYTQARGLNYGGQAKAWSHATLEAIAERSLRQARRIALIDWHTGLGEPAEAFFLCFNERDGAAWQRACAWWGQDEIETRGGFSGAARPNYTGLLFHGVQRYAPQAEVTGAVVEFGTLPRVEMRRALQQDLQRKFNPALDDAERMKAREQILEAFAPQSVLWRQRVLTRAIDIQHQALEGLRAWQ